MSLISGIVSAFNWLKKVFVDHTQSAAPVAVTVTETIKTMLANPVFGLLTNIADAITGTQVPSNIAGLINITVIKALTVELAIEGLPDNPTPDQVLTFEQNIMKAFNVTDNNSKLYTVLAADVYGIVQKNIDNGATNFADWVDAIEQAYLDYQKDLAANAPVLSASVANGKTK